MSDDDYYQEEPTRYYGDEAWRIGEIVIRTSTREAAKIVRADAYGLEVENRFGTKQGPRMHFDTASDDEIARFLKEEEFGTPEFFLREARECVSNGQYELAAQADLKAAHLCPSNSDSWLRATLHFLFANKPAAAITPAQVYYERCPERLDSRMLYASCLFQMERTEDAIKLLPTLTQLSDEELLRINDGEFETGNRSEYYLNIPYVCLPFYEELVRRFPGNADYWRQFAHALNEAQQTESSAYAHARYLELEPNNEEPPLNEDDRILT